jgi:hypothetical protein
MQASTVHDPPACRHLATQVSVATVADFVDSYERFHGLATAAGDLKDVQRPWALKTILGGLPSGARLCEIGAGEPLVAGTLAQLGYRVTVVDPYDGSGNGPTALAHFRNAYPNLRFVGRHFSPHLTELTPGEFDAVYSISVLEHLDAAAVNDVVAASRRFLRTGGSHIHAIDFVAAGADSDYHRRMLEECLRHFDVTPVTISALLENAMADPETYFLSAEAHNRWRGATPYSQFPMRKVISVQCVKHGVPE